MAGHTTGGRSEKSDEVTAIPLKKRNGRRRSGRRNLGRVYLLMERVKLKERNDRHCQRLPLILSVGGDRSRRNGGGRRISRSTTLWCRAMLAIAAARLGYMFSGPGQRRPRNNRVRHQEKSQQQRDRNSHGL